MISIVLNGVTGCMCRKIVNIAQLDESIKIVAGVCYENGSAEKENEFNFPISSNFPNVKADAIIDFSHPSTLNKMLDYAVKNKIPVVIATTGYNDEQIKLIETTSKKIPIFFSYNMSLGINVLINLVQKAYEILGKNFDVEIIEQHHNKKIDAPSGTAIMIADSINSVTKNQLNYIFCRKQNETKRTKNEIGIHSVRGGTIVGEHEVLFAGDNETISIKHSAQDKAIFALGSIKAAEFVKNKPAGLYNMKDLIAI